jgi:hypothetical protein
MPTWCNSAIIRSCRDRDPGSNPGVGVPVRGNPAEGGTRARERRRRFPTECALAHAWGCSLRQAPFRRCIHTESLRRCRARKGLQPAWSSVAFPGSPEVRQPVRDEPVLWPRQSCSGCRARSSIDKQTTFGPMVQRTTTRALGARNRGSNPRRPTLPRWPSMVRHLPATEGSPLRRVPGSSPGRGVPLGERGGVRQGLLCRRVVRQADR